MMRDILVNLIEQKGWLSIYDLYFDNAGNVRVLATGGCIAFDKSTNTFYVLSSNSPTESTVITSTFLQGESHRLGQLAILTITTTDHLQRFNLNTLKNKGDFISDMKLPVIPKVAKDVDISSFGKNVDRMDGAIKIALYTNQVLEAGQFINSAYDDNGVVADYIFEQAMEDFYECGSLLVSKEMVDNFHENQGKFKTFLTTQLGLTALNII